MCATHRSSLFDTYVTWLIEYAGVYKMGMLVTMAMPKRHILTMYSSVPFY